MFTQFSFTDRNSAIKKNLTCGTCILKYWNLLSEACILNLLSTVVCGMSFSAVSAKLEQKPRFCGRHRSCFCKEQLFSCVCCRCNVNPPLACPLSVAISCVSGSLRVNDMTVFSFPSDNCDCFDAYKTFTPLFSSLICYAWRIAVSCHGMNCNLPRVLRARKCIFIHSFIHSFIFV